MVAEILDSSTIDQWRHVDVTLNPADIETKGKSVHEQEKSEWLIGLAWLRKKNVWPQVVQPSRCAAFRRCLRANGLKVRESYDDSRVN